MRFTHTKCGGEIDVKKRRCARCKKKWNSLSFQTDAIGIRPMTNSAGKLVPDKVIPSKKPTSYANWLDRVPTWLDLGLTQTVVSKLPRWPRWVRILTTIVFVIIVVVITLLIWR